MNKLKLIIHTTCNFDLHIFVIIFLFMMKVSLD